MCDYSLHKWYYKSNYEYSFEFTTKEYMIFTKFLPFTKNAEIKLTTNTNNNGYELNIDENTPNTPQMYNRLLVPVVYKASIKYMTDGASSDCLLESNIFLVNHPENAKNYINDVELDFKLLI